MKKSRGLIVTLVPLFTVGVALWFWPGTAAFADDKRSNSQHESPSSSGREGDHQDEHNGDHDGDHTSGHENDEGDKCTVCHNPHNFHEISIPCDQVDKFLRDHPGDFRGHCSTTPNTNR
jgi:hypothetical protein